MGRSIYLASSWRNVLQPNILSVLRGDGHSVYDFRNPAPGESGFSWRHIGDRFGKCVRCGEEDPLKKPASCPATARNVRIDGHIEFKADPHDWKGGWDAAHFATAVLDHPISAKGFAFDMDALDAASACVLIQPCGRSAHLELGHATGQGKLTVVYYPELDEPELMVRMCDYVVTSVPELRKVLSRNRPPPRWQRDVEKYDAQFPNVDIKDTYPSPRDAFEGDSPKLGPCRPYRHRACRDCGECWRHGECKCGPEAIA